MPDIISGYFVLSKTKLANPKPADSDRFYVLDRFDCAPPPAGSIEQFPPQDNPHLPFIIQESLQDDEMDRLIHFLESSFPPTGPKPLTVELHFMSEVGFNPLTIDYDSWFRRRHQHVVPCFTVTIGVHVEYDVYDVRITAGRDMRHNGQIFPKGDELASFKAADPKRYRFEVRYDFNPKCCDKPPRRVPEPKTDVWLPKPRPVEAGVETDIDDLNDVGDYPENRD